MIMDGRKSEFGAVTFLDVLGWKGIWQQNSTAIDTLYAMVKRIDEISKEVSSQFQNEPELRGKTEITRILSISDTIAIFTAASPILSVEIQSKICSKVLPEALSQELPLRGAISYGEYSIKENIMLGYAVDEAASWHESTDWIGVVLTPSAYIKVKDAKIDSIRMYDKIPFKRPMKRPNLCVKWTYEDKKELIAIIDKKGPLVPEIAPKYLNTLTFLESEE